MGVHCEAKKLLKKSAFSIMFVITLLFIIRGGIKGIIIKHCSMDEYALGLVKGSLSFLNR